MADKLVDGDFLGRLVLGSYEVAMGAVMEAMESHADLFGGSGTQVIATYPEHIIAASPDGQFYRAKWSLDEETGDVVFSDIEDIEVPVYESDKMGSQVRRQAMDAVDSILHQKEDASDRILELAGLVRSGVKLTAEGVEEQFEKEPFQESDWFQAVRENESSIRTFLGPDVDKVASVKPAFSHLVSEDVDEDDAEDYRSRVVEALRRLRSTISSMHDQTDLARQVDESSRLRSGGDDAEMAASEFAEFIQGYTDDLMELRGLVEDAIAVSEDGCVKCLARVHDGVASQIKEWALAAAFAEKMSNRFESRDAA